eukprot:gene37654-46450_t
MAHALKNVFSLKGNSADNAPTTVLTLMNSNDQEVPPRINLADNDEPICTQAGKKNVIVFGISGSGKSTLMETLMNPDYVPPAQQAFSITEKVTSFNVIVGVTAEGKLYQQSVNILDTPGLFEIKENQTRDRKNEVILDVIGVAIEQNMLEFNMALITHRYGATLNKDNIEAIKAIQIFLGANLKNNCGLVITGCEEKEHLMKKYIKDMKESESTSEVMDFFGDRIYFTGANDHAIWEKAKHDERYKGHTLLMNESVRNLRKKFLGEVLNFPPPGMSIQINQLRQRFDEVQRNL